MSSVKGTSLLAAVLLLGFVGTASGACTVSVSGTNFGTYLSIDPAPLDTSGDIFINCTNGNQYNIKLDAGINGYFPRLMTSPLVTVTTPLVYNLYRDSAHTEVWGDGMGGTYTQSGFGTGNTDIFRVYGRIPPGQKVEPGIYTDAIAVLVEF
jgi:spore coat protein U-like protein